MTVFPIFYFGPIDYFVALDKHNSFYLDAEENYRKQSYRSRTNILGANGKLTLTIPIQHDGKRRMKEKKISHDSDWQKLHIKSLQSAYQSSPYFEFYEDELHNIFQTKEIFLWDFNMKTLEFINQTLQLNLKYQTTEKYQEIVEKDYRGSFSPKQNKVKNETEYHQVFVEKLGFTPRLSILDLLFNEGPNAITYLKRNN